MSMHINTFSISDYNKICRLCLKKDSNFNKIKYIFADREERLEEIIYENLRIKVDIMDKLPLQICVSCRQKITKFIEFRNKCLNNDEVLRLHYLINQDEEPDVNIEHPIIKTENIKVEIEMEEQVTLADTKEEVQLMRSTNKVVKKRGRPKGRKTKTEPRTEIKQRNSVRVHKFKQFLKSIKENQHSDSDDLEQQDEMGEFISTNRQRKSKKKIYMTCELCDENFERSFMPYHLNIHNNVFPYKCDYCNSAFTSPMDKKSHHIYEHGTNSVKCKICNLIFRTPNALSRHHKSVHTRKAICYCKMCGLKCCSKDVLKRHLMIHTGEKPYKCDVCNSRFRVSYNLKTHMRIHTNEKQYRCEICDAEFSYHLALRKHVQEHMNTNTYSSILEY